ncbi:SR-related and CTD-associated factor 4-like [Entelurus aequoreus]|uniref:SR-related and CTD-associated factor 4-like n=1 Tax=Entelurus aequoreus TaxID=161455 RepID=UPI002B1D8E65|nr:SR-related and CTD-associated factor 4-like [Entelurus aequoreus]
MDAVNAFNQELFSLMDSRPPISRAKMISITKSAIKALKLYKHVVQIVEKFIKKCKPEYKVAGLYVVDSIVRQSRHQFGADKDVFGPRFTKNITGTFENLCLCPLEDRSKLVRVLNLWQKNSVFKSEVIQPLLDMAASGGAAPYAGSDEPGTPPSPAKEAVPTVTTANPAAAPAGQLQKEDNPFAAVAELFQTTQGQQLQQMLQNFQQQPAKAEPPPQPPAPQLDVQHAARVFSPGPPRPAPPSQQKTAFDRTLLDRFDYDDEPDAGEDKDDSSHPSFMQQPHSFPPSMMNMSQDPSHQVALPPNGQLSAFGMLPGQGFPVMGHLPPGQQPPGFPGGFFPSGSAQQDSSVDAGSSMRDGRHGQRSRSGSRSPKRRRSRSNSRTRRSRHRRSRSRDRRQQSPRSRSQERKERERERERRQKGLPPSKNETLSICSTTLWVGQLDKRTQQQDVACLLEEFGPIDSINMIPPRGCAYIVMIHRHDAFRALQKLSRGPYKVNQKAIKIAWALNKGIKADLKEYWNVELGVTYVPWSKVREDQLEELKEGGVLDGDTLSPEWSTARKALMNPEELNHNGGAESQQHEEAHLLAAATPAQLPPMQQPMMGMGPVPPPGFPAPMGMPPPSFPPGMPPPPFIRPGFNPMQMPPGFPPPRTMPLGPPPPAKGEDMALGPAGLVTRKHEEVSDAPNFFNNQMGAMCNQVGAPPGSIQPPTGGLLGARPSLIPMQRPPGPPLLHGQRFPPPRGPHSPAMPPVPQQIMHRGPHAPMMRHDAPPPKGGFGMPPSHSIRPPFPPHGPPPHGPPPPFVRPGVPRSGDGPEERSSRPLRGEWTGFRDQEPDRERDRERDRGFGGARRPFGDRARGGDRMDARDRLGGWQEDGDQRGGGWERDRDRRDWRDRRSSLDRDWERGRGGDGERENGRGEGGDRGRAEGGDRGRAEGGDRGRADGASRESGRGADGKEGGRPRRRERTTRWDRDDRLAELENMDKFRSPKALQPSASQPAALQPSASQPAALQPSAPQPSAPQPAAPQPSAPQPAAPQPSAPQPAAPQPAAPQPAAPQPSAPQPAAPQPSAPQPAAPQPSAPQPAVSQSAAPQSAAPQPAASTETCKGPVLEAPQKTTESAPSAPPPQPDAAEPPSSEAQTESVEAKPEAAS